MKMRRMSEEDRSIEAKKEQARLSKHIVSEIIDSNKKRLICSLFSVYLIHHRQIMSR